MPGDADATRARLLDAATTEFAAHGIAGARVDRIAAAARSNKAQIYHYFDSKARLFDAVFTRMTAQTLDEVPLDADDLPGYAGRLFDSYERRPYVQRLATWHRLERGGDSAALLEAVSRSYANKLAAIEAAQRDGRLADRFSPVELLGLVLAVSGFWSSAVPEFDALAPSSPAQRRRVVVEAVARLVAP